MLCFTVMDHDMMTRNDFEGETFLSLSSVPGVNGGENISNIAPIDMPLLQPKEKSEHLLSNKVLFPGLLTFHVICFFT